MNAPDDPRRTQSSNLCAECGLCCDGSIFSHVELSARDCSQLGMKFKPGATLSFPCQNLSGRCCSVYSDRPAICASYRCKTLIAFEDDRITLPDAQRIIREAARLGKEFEESIPSGVTRKQAIICVVKDQCPDEASTEEFLRLRLTYVALQAVVDRHMRYTSDRVIRSAMRPD